jgi:hypothetical protein
MYNYHTVIKTYVNALAKARKTLKHAERQAWDERNKASAPASQAYETAVAPSNIGYELAIETAWRARDEAQAVAIKNLVEAVCQARTP